MTTDDLLERVRDILSQRTGIVEKRMVGGRGFAVEGQLCCGVNRDGLVVRLGDDARLAALALPHVQPMMMGGRPTRAFVQVDLSACEDELVLNEWINKGVDFALNLAPKGSRRPRS